ncbi:bifunctional farnesyl-diphosphate farnesyltransferase/squalene synthase [Ascosphaera aggregata]|nr:bifunctional farnesyl-diphosphate farnesyltransferase/squalene synthase [Ascosphaera aggregata]
MPSLADVAYYSVHPQQLRAICQWKLWHNPVHDHELEGASESQMKCLEFLKKTSRSFSAVIMELHPDLLMPVCLFYLILRGLDTIEDDTSIPFTKKEILLREFEAKLEEDGWTFTGNRETEKDRELLVQFDVVIAEFKKIKPAFQTIIKNITARMGSGMADYARRADLGDDKIETVKDYDLYCYYVAGLVGEGLTRLFIEAGFANPALVDRPELFISMGLFLQKTNIIRDIREDNDDNRRFWPKEIWSKHVDKWEDLFDPSHRDAALNVNSEMILDALNHFDQCLFYLTGIKEQSVFNFCAIPQSMAIATLELCFRNPEIYEKNIKITKGDACALMWGSTQNLRVLAEIVKQYIRRIHAKNSPRDPNFLKISAQCGQIEKFIATIFPPQTPESAARQMKVEEAKKAGDVQAARAAMDPRSEADIAHDQSGQAAFNDKQEICLLVAATVGSVLVLAIVMMIVAQCFGARFDLAFKSIAAGNFIPSGVPNAAKESISTGVESATSAIREEL